MTPLSPELVADDPRLNNVLWLADRATLKLPIGAVPEHFVPGLNAGRVTYVPLSWLPSDIGDAVKEVLRLRTLAAQLAERDAELVRVTAERDSAREALRMMKSWDFPGDLQDMAVRYETATRRIAALTEALTFYADEATYETQYERMPCDCCTDIFEPINDDKGAIARAAITTDKEPRYER